MKDIAEVHGIQTFVGKQKFKKGPLVYFIFLNVNRFEKSVTSNIQDDCCQFVFIWIQIAMRFSKHELYKECSFKG